MKHAPIHAPTPRPGRIHLASGAGPMAGPMAGPTAGPMTSPIAGRFLGGFLGLTALALLASCDPYGDFNENPNDSLGGVDVVKFPPANLGTGGDRKRPGVGRFVELRAYAGGAEIGYFSFPMPAVAAGGDPLRVRENDAPTTAVPTPSAFVFDPTETSPFPADDDYACNPPRGYVFDRRTDEMDLSQQGIVFSALPESPYAEGMAATSSYVPIVTQVALPTADTACQAFKSEALVAQGSSVRPGGSGILPGSGKLLAALIIDPAALVFPREFATGNYPANYEDPALAGKPHLGFGLQRYGWFKRYIVGYLEGGYFPVTNEMVMEGMPATMKMVTRLRPQRLFVPRRITMGMMSAAGRAGQGYDLLEAKRGTGGYSPLCQIWEYGDPMMPIASTAVPRNVSDVLANPALNAAAVAPASYVYCLQVR